MFRKADRSLLASTQSLALALYSRVERLEASQDKLLQSHAALEQTVTALNLNLLQMSADIPKHVQAGVIATELNIARVSQFVGSNQAVLDTLVQRVTDEGLAIRALLTALDKKLDAAMEGGRAVSRQINHLEMFGKSNGKRKR